MVTFKVSEAVQYVQMLPSHRAKVGWPVRLLGASAM